MSSVEKRKRNVSSEKPPLSAFAARRALKSDIASLKRPNSAIEAEVSSDSHKKVRLDGLNSEDLEISADIKIVSNKKPGDTELGANGTLAGLGGDSQSTSLQSREEYVEVPIQRPSVAFSTYKPNKQNFKQLAGGKISLHIAPGERLVILGQCDISIVHGEITLLGAILRPSSKVHRLYASSSHSLPVIRCSATDINDAEIVLHQCESGLASLQNLSSLFGRLWNDEPTFVGPEYDNLLQTQKLSTFQILFSSRDGPERAYLQPIVSPPEWNVVLAKCSESGGSKPKVVFICGPKSSGKSTFAKLLGNRLVSRTMNSSRQSKIGSIDGVAVLDIDPGQPEYSPPGQLALIHIQQPNFGPPFSHPVPDLSNRVLRSHSIGAITPAMDPRLYVACVLDLFSHYRNLLSVNPSCPLIINTPGWVLGTGLAILVELVEKIQPSEIIYMSEDGPAEVIESLKDAAKLIPVIALPSQISEYTTRTAAHLRKMQYMSYFHLQNTYKEELAWSKEPLTAVPPLEICYSGESSGILGIVCYGEQPPANLLAATINGSLVSVVVINDISAIAGWNSKTVDYVQPEYQMDGTETPDLEDGVLDNQALDPQDLLQPWIIRTPGEDLPYFNPANAIYLDPSNSYSIGLALIRGIAAARRRIQVLTPIDQGVIEEVRRAGKMIVLISGRLDTPGWAYTEPLMQKSTKERDITNQDNNCMLIDEETDTANFDESDSEEVPIELTEIDDHLQEMPWVQKLEGARGRGIGSRVWRIRRDLGKFNDGGD